MAVITIRNVPDEVLAKLKAIAARNRRSLQEQALAYLEQAALLNETDPLERAAAIRRKLKGLRLGDIVEDVRAERAR
jgi:plasmid stability protein